MSGVFVPQSSSANSWSSAEIRSLRDLAGSGVPLEAIAAALHRSASAVKNKAGMHGISLQKSRKSQLLTAGDCRVLVQID